MSTLLENMRNLAVQSRSTTAWMTAALLAGALSGSFHAAAQTQRPAIVPMAQTTGTGATPSATANASPLSIGGLSDLPIGPGEMVHITMFDAPELSVITRVSMSGDIPVPLLGVFHIGGMSSADAAKKIEDLYKAGNFVLSPNVAVTVDSTTTGITVLGEVHSPGIFPPSGKHMLSDVIASAGGLTANTGRVIEVSNTNSPEDKTYIPWDPTMHNTASYDRIVNPGDRVFVRSCGIAYVGGNVAKPGAYSLCGSRQMTASELVALAGGTLPASATQHTTIIRTHPDGSKTALQVDIHKVLMSKAADLVVQEDDVLYVPHSTVKDVLKMASQYSLAIAGPLLYIAQ